MFQLPTCFESRGAPAPQCGRSTFCRGTRTDTLVVLLFGFLIGLVCFVWMHQCVPKQDGLATYSVRPQGSSQVSSLCADQIEWMLAFYSWFCIVFSVARAAEQFCFLFVRLLRMLVFYWQCFCRSLCEVNGAFHVQGVQESVIGVGVMDEFCFSLLRLLRMLGFVQKKCVTYFAVASSMPVNSYFDLNWVDQKSIFNFVMIARAEEKYYKSLQIHDSISILRVSVDMCALVCCRVGAKRVKSMTRTKKQYYKVMQAKRQRVVGDIANGILVRHVLCCFNLFCFVNYGSKCIACGRSPFWFS